MLIRLSLLIGARSCPAETFMVNIRPRYHLKCPLFVLYYCPTFTQILVLLYLKSFCGFFFNLPLLSFVSLCLCFFFFFFSCFDAIVFLLLLLMRSYGMGLRRLGVTYPVSFLSRLVSIPSRPYFMPCIDAKNKQTNYPTYELPKQKNTFLNTYSLVIIIIMWQYHYYYYYYYYYYFRRLGVRLSGNRCP